MRREKYGVPLVASRSKHSPRLLEIRRRNGVRQHHARSAQLGPHDCRQRACPCRHRCERVARLANMQQCAAHKGEMMACVVKADCVKFDVVSRRAADLGTIKTLDARCELMEQECQVKLSAMEEKMINDWAILAAYSEMTEEWGHQIEIDKNCVDL